MGWLVLAGSSLSGQRGLSWMGDAQCFGVAALAGIPLLKFTLFILLAAVKRKDTESVWRACQLLALVLPPPSKGEHFRNLNPPSAIKNITSFSAERSKCCSNNGMVHEYGFRNYTIVNIIIYKCCDTYIFITFAVHGSIASLQELVAALCSEWLRSDRSICLPTCKGQYRIAE